MNPTQQRQNFHASANSQGDAEVLREARDLVDQFLRYLKFAHLGLDVVDIGDLPFRKPLLVSAIRLLIANENSQTTRQQLRKVGLSLASYQENVGERMTIRPAGAEASMSEEALQALMQKHRHQIARIDRAFALMAAERTRLDDLFQESVRVAERRESNAAAAARRSSFDSAGTYSPYL